MTEKEWFAMACEEIRGEFFPDEPRCYPHEGYRIVAFGEAPETERSIAISIQALSGLEDGVLRKKLAEAIAMIRNGKQRRVRIHKDGSVEPDPSSFEKPKGVL